MRLDLTQSFFTKHFQLIVSRKLLGWKLVNSFSRKKYTSPRPPPKNSLKHDWKRELGSEDAQRPEGEVVQQFRSSNQTNQFQIQVVWPKATIERGNSLLKPIQSEHTRTTQDGRKTFRSQEIDTCSFHEEAGKTQTCPSDDSESLNVEMAHDRTGQLVVDTHRKCARWLQNTFLS